VALLNKLKNKQFMSLAGTGTQAVLNVLTGAVLYRNLTQAEAGSWFFFQATFVLIDTFRTGLLQTAFITYYSGAIKERAQTVAGSTWYLAFIITCLALVINIPAFFILKYITNPSIIVIIKWFTLTFFATLPLVIATWILQAEQSFDKIFLVRLINQGSFIIMVIAAIILKQLTLNMVLITNLVSCVITSLVVWVLGWTQFKTIANRTKECVMELFHFGKFSVGTTISSNLLRSSDTFIINFTLGPAAVAVYNIPQTLMNIIDVPLRSFVATGMSSLAAAFNRNDDNELVYILKKYAGMLTIIFLPVSIVAIFLADFGVGLLAGGKYAHSEAANVFRIFIAFAVFFPLDRFTGVTLDVIHQPRVNFIKVLIMLAFNVVGDVLGVYLMHNIYGVAIASIPTFFIGTFFGYYSLKKFLNFSLWQTVVLGYKECMLLVVKLTRRRKATAV
jgi:O-antigen/teichoic acid export membrane protein